MSDNRKYPRYRCNLKSKFEFFEGSPEEIESKRSKKKKGKGIILDLSQGGTFLVSNERLSPGIPMRIFFSTKGGKLSPEGRIVRTGLLRNNPSEIAKRLSGTKVKKEVYIAVEFKDLIEFSESDLS